MMSTMLLNNVFITYSVLLSSEYEFFMKVFFTKHVLCVIMSVKERVWTI